MEMPKPTEEHRRLEKLAGKWTGEEKIHPTPWDPVGGPATSTWEAHVACDGFWLVADYVETRNGQVGYRGHGVYGYDRKERAWTMLGWVRPWANAVVKPLVRDPPANPAPVATARDKRSFRDTIYLLAWICRVAVNPC